MTTVLEEAVTADAARLSIGGLEFRLSAGGRRLRQDASAFYRPFLVGASEPAAADVVDVSLEPAPRPGFEGSEIFRSEATWSLHARGPEREFVFRAPGTGEALYVARFRPGSRSVVIICAPALSGEDAGGPFLESPFRYPLDQVLSMYFLAGRGCVVHSAGHVYRRAGLVFPGVSGAGKSTFSRLAAGRPGWAPLSDDRTVVAIAEGGPVVYGTPWPGEGRVAENRKAPLERILFLEKAQENGVRPIGPAETLSRLFPVVAIPWFDRDVLPGALSACEAIAGAVDGAVLGFRPDAGAAKAVENFIGSAA